MAVPPRGSPSVFLPGGPYRPARGEPKRGDAIERRPPLKGKQTTCTDFGSLFKAVVRMTPNPQNVTEDLGSPKLTQASTPLAGKRARQHESIRKSRSSNKGIGSMDTHNAPHHAADHGVVSPRLVLTRQGRRRRQSARPVGKRTRSPSLIGLVTPIGKGATPALPSATLRRGRTWSASRASPEPSRPPNTARTARRRTGWHR